MLKLPWMSEAMQVTVLVPTGKAERLGGVLPNAATAQLSVAVTLKVTFWKHAPSAVTTTMLVGTAITGFSSSTTVTVKAQVSELPLASVTTKTFVVLPTKKVPPLVTPAVWTRVAEQLSSKVTV